MFVTLWYAKGTEGALKGLCIDHDIEVQYWSDALKLACLEKVFQTHNLVDIHNHYFYSPKL